MSPFDLSAMTIGPLRVANSHKSSDQVSCSTRSLCTHLRHIVSAGVCETVRVGAGLEVGGSKGLDGLRLYIDLMPGTCPGDSILLVAC